MTPALLILLATAAADPAPKAGPRPAVTLEATFQEYPVTPARDGPGAFGRGVGGLDRDRRPAAPPRPIVGLRVRLACGDAAATVVTKGLVQTVARSEDGKTATIAFRLSEQRDAGRLVVPPVSDLGLVALRPGEVAVVYQSGLNTTGEVITAAFDGKVALTVEYDVAAVWGPRFGVVGGKLTAVPDKLKDREKPAGKKDEKPKGGDGK